MMFIFILAFFVFSVFALYLLNYKNKREFVNHLFYAFLSSGMFMGLSVIFLSASKYAYILKFDDAIVRYTIGEIITAYFNTLIITAFSISIISVVFFCIKFVCKSKKSIKSFKYKC
jgi:ABC-type Mn2+/Zn2+ transport system permease subunit